MLQNSLIENNKDIYFNFSFTKDGSVGLYNEQVADVYHSVFGARTEGWEKFVTPLKFEKNFYNKKSIKVLDICFGIGYNTKALLKKLLQTDYKGSVFIDALEYDKNLVSISPFIKDGYFKSYPQISFILFTNFLNSIIENSSFVNNVMFENVNKKFFEAFYRDLIKKTHFNRYNYDPMSQKNAFVHNIYYHCISQRNKKALKPLKIDKFVIKPYFNDARNVIKSLNDKYDIVFLDAFTPTKLPTLWSYDFFKELYRLSSSSTMIVTYSNSAAVRHAMSDAGFSVGKLFDKANRHCGTVAAINNSLISNPLDEYDIGLMNTNAGVYFRDEGLVNSSEDILKEYNHRKQSLNLESSSHYIKRYKEQNEEYVNDSI